MQPGEHPLTPPDGIWRWRLLAGLLILGSAGLRLAYLATSCPLDLAPDEAHYWDWSRHLDWSYYSKGPLVAYLIRAGCAVLGSWSQQWIASEMLAVRLPAVLCGGLLLASMYLLTVQVFGRERLAVAVVVLGLTFPVLAAGSALMTIDAPYTCCWGWALVLGHQAIFRRAAWAWPAAGLVVGVGILAKYTMILWVPSIALFLWFTPGYRSLLFRPGFWIMALTGAACCLPVLVWNAQHEWASWRHVSGQAGLRDTPGIRWLGPLTYVGTQFALLLGFWFVGWAASLWAHRPWKEREAGVCYLWWMSVPMFVVFLGFSLKAAEEPNWPVTAYLSGMVLTAAWLSRQLQSPWIGYRYLTRACIASACALGLALTLLMHHTDWVQPILLSVSGAATEDRPLPLRRFDPTCRLRGWRTLAAEVDAIRERLDAEGAEPILAGAGWTLPGELGFYCAGHPTVYSVGLALGDRRSQYDFWRPNPVWDADRFLGKTVILVEGSSPILFRVFGQVEPPRQVVYREQGQPVAAWTVTVCWGFRGFPYGPENLPWEHF